MHRIKEIPLLAEDDSFVSPLSILRGLYGLNACHAIAQDTFFLGAQVCQRMLQEKSTRIRYSGEQAQSHFTVVNGTVYTGPISKTLANYTTALRELHSVGGINSFLTEVQEFGERRVNEHFTIHESGRAGLAYGFSSPIIFRAANITKGEYFATINALAADHLDGCQPLIILTE